MAKSINVVNKRFFEELECMRYTALIEHTNLWDITPTFNEIKSTVKELSREV